MLLLLATASCSRAASLPRPVLRRLLQAQTMTPITFTYVLSSQAAHQHCQSLFQVACTE